MKEIGIEKLIELLKNWDGRNITYNKQSDGGYMFWVGDLAFREERICSKKFGFIKWLVENDKIDFSRDGDLSNELVNLFGRKLDNAEGVIALLSIQDEPIRFLCEIIK